jgi:predicted RNA binding protein YcfA (HicA-like mRNA interferase family)
LATCTYDEFRRRLRRLGFVLVRSRKHETWERTAPDGAILQVRLRHKGKREIPAGTFSEMLRQAGVTRADFETFS